MAANNSPHDDDVVAGTDHRAAIVALESENDAQRAEIEHLNSVVDEFADVKDTARALLTHVSEQKEKNETLQSELDRVGREMAESLEDANEECVRARRDLGEKEGELAELRDKCDDLADHLESEKLMNAERTEELERLEAAGSADVARLEKEFSIAQTTIDNFTNEIETTEQEVARERKLREEAENEIARLRQGISDGEDEAREKDREMERLSTRAEESEGIDRELERWKADNEKLRTELEQSTGEIEQLRRLRGESMRGKSQLELELQQASARLEEREADENGAAEKNAKLQSEFEILTRTMDEASQCISEWEIKADRWDQDAADAAKKAEAAMEEKDRELQQLNSQMDECKKVRDDETEKSKKLQSEVDRANAEVEEYKSAVDEEMELNRTLQSDLERATGERDELKVKLDQPSQGQSVAEKGTAAAAQGKDGDSQQLRTQMEGWKATAADEIKKCKQLQLELERSTSENAKERDSKDAALRGKVELESKVDGLNRVIVVAKENAKELESKIQRLDLDVGIARENADAAMQEKDRELQELNSRMDGYKTATDDEAKRSKRLESEIEGLNLAIAAAVENADEMESKFGRLNQDMVLSRENAEAAMGEKDRALQQLNSRIEEYKAATDNGSESNTIMQLEIDLVTGERDDALQANSELKRKVDRLGDCLSVAERSADAAMQDKNKELQELKDQVRECKESAKTLQSDLESVNRERDEAFQCSSELKSELDQLRQDMSVAEKNSATMMEQKDRELQGPNGRAEKRNPTVKNVEAGSNYVLTLQLKQVTGERDKLLQRNSDLESRVDRLDRDMIAFVETADAVMKEKDRALQRLSIRLKEVNALKESHGATGQTGSIDGDGSSHRSNGSDTHSQHGSLTSVASDGAILKSASRPKQIDGTNGRSSGRTKGRLGSILSRFGSQRSATESDAKSQEGPEVMVHGRSTTGSDAKPKEISERSVHEPDRTMDEPEAVISPNIALFERVKCLIEEMNPEEGPNNNAQLKAALASLGEEMGGWSTKVLILQAKLKDLELQYAALKEELARLKNTNSSQERDIKVLKATEKDFESTVSLQCMQNKTLKDELARLRNMIDDMGNHNSSQEDDVEALKAQVATLELKRRLLQDERRTTEEALKAQVECRDLIISSLVPRTSEVKSHDLSQDPDQVV